MSKLFHMRLTEADEANLAKVQARTGLTSSAVMRSLLHQAASGETPKAATKAEPERREVARQARAKPFVSRLDKSAFLRGGRAK